MRIRHFNETTFLLSFQCKVFQRQQWLPALSAVIDKQRWQNIYNERFHPKFDNEMLTAPTWNSGGLKSLLIT